MRKRRYLSQRQKPILFKTCMLRFGFEEGHSYELLIQKEKASKENRSGNGDESIAK